MMKISKALAIISLVVVLGTAGGMAFASGKAANFCPGECPREGIEQKAEMQARMRECLAQALDEGKITQEQYDEMINRSPENPSPNFRKHGPKGIKPSLSDE